MTESDILAALRAKHANDVWFGKPKLGPSWGATALRIMDGLAIKKSWASPCFSGYEVKTSRSDFLSDEKWPAYLPACNRFYWACPRGLIKLSEIDDRCGLVYVNDSGRAYTRRKALYRDIEPPAGLLYYLILSRVDMDEHAGTGTDYAAFNRAERIKACREWLAGKADCRKLGYELRTALPRRLDEMELDLQAKDARLQEWEKVAKSLNILGAWALRDAIERLPTDPLVGQLPRLRQALELGIEAIDRVKPRGVVELPQEGADDDTPRT